MFKNKYNVIQLTKKSYKTRQSKPSLELQQKHWLPWDQARYKQPWWMACKEHDIVTKSPDYLRYRNDIEYIS